VFHQRLLYLLEHSLSVQKNHQFNKT